MTGKRFFLGSANKDFHVLNLRKVVCERIHNCINGGLFVEYSAWMICGDRAREVNEGGPIGGDEQFLDFGIFRQRRRERGRNGSILKLLQNLFGAIDELGRLKDGLFLTR